ncbi:carbohydrate ABC transporter permease [Bradyrhizobium erythrophlei]|uniref:carbohydrate ABC transporter permease n=1 Tax=Bradyrhizobium erythrophlei TaxID=1437360 RepID=UPI0035E4E26E
MKPDATVRVFLLLGLAVTAVFIVLPAAQAILLSFQSINSFVAAGKWIGFANYRRILAVPEFWRDLWTGTLYATVSVALQVVLGIASALVLHAPIRGQSLFRAIAILPYILPTVVVAISFQWMLDGNVGIVTHWLKALGITGFVWSDSSSAAFATVVAISVWMWTPFVTICVLAALQTIPDDLYAAARVDGAGPLQRFRYVTLPAIRDVLVVVVLLRAIWMFNKFDVIWLMTQGGPLGATEHLPVLSYHMAFRLYDIGGGAAVATVSLLLLTLALGAFFRRFPIEM